LANDILVAKESGASVFCFNIRNDPNVERLATEEGVTIVSNDVIYRLIERAKDVFSQFLPPRPVEIIHGKAVVLAVFDIGGIASRVAGLRVEEGKLYKDVVPDVDSSKKLSCDYRVLRDGVVMSSSSSNSAPRATSLKTHKEDVNEVSRGSECGLSLSNFNDFQKGDVIECFSIEMKQEFV
jgi:translation initiation factor IF-2